MKSKILKPLEENIQKYLYEFKKGKIFLYMIQNTNQKENY